MENRINGKRALDDDQLSRDVQKKFKVADYKCENKRNEQENSKKWSILPSVVYELLALFKNSEKQNQENNSYDIKGEYKIIPNDDCQEKLLNKNENSIVDQKYSLMLNEKPSHNKEILNTIETNKSAILKLEKSTLSPTKLDSFEIKKNNVDGENKILNTTTTLIENIENNDFQKEKNSNNIKKFQIVSIDNCQEKLLNNINESENLNKDQKCSLIFDENPIKKYLNTIETEKSIVYKSCVENSTLVLTKLDLLTNKKENVDIKEETFKVPTFVDNFKNNDVQKVIKKYEKNDMISYSKKQPIPAQCSNTSTIKIAEGNTIKLMSKTETMIMLEKRNQLFDLLKTLYLNDTSKMPKTKPPHCVCHYCITVDNLPKEQTLVSKLFASKNNLHDIDLNNEEQLNGDMYSLKKTISNCSVCKSKNIYSIKTCNCINKLNLLKKKNTSPKDVWVDKLISLMRKNEKTHSAPKSNSNPKSHNETVMSKVRKTAERIKLNLKSKAYDFGKKSKTNNISNKSDARHVKQNKYNEKLQFKKDSYRRYRNNSRY